MRSFRGQQNRFHGETGFSNFIMIFFLAWILLTVFRGMPVQAAYDFRELDRDIVVVIDPGHGGDNEGTKENGFCEKEMTLVTAGALCERLSQFDGVTVYMTRTEDTDMSLKERAEYAKSVGADYLFSIHYNASENHELFGSEVWVPLEAPYNVYGYQFGSALLTRLQDNGLFVRGIKTRKNDRGTDYYGILRESAALEIPAVIIEHCHVDEARDYVYCDSREKQERMGYEDAEAIAQFLGLASEDLGVDYGGEPEDPFLQKVFALDTGKVVQSTLKDTTPPEICSIERISEDYAGLQAAIQVTAADYDSPLMYYAYSLDGGLTYSPRQPWPGSNTLTGEYQDVFQVTLEIPQGVIPSICIRAYNQFEAYTESNILEGYSVFQSPQEQEQEESTEISETAAGEAAKEASGESLQASAGGWLGSSEKAQQDKAAAHVIGIQDFILVSLLAALALLVLMMVLQIVQFGKRKRRRHNRKR